MTEPQQTILIVDDEIINIMILIELLEDEHDIMVAKSGQEALNIAQSGKVIDLILLDIVMPEMDGYTVCARLKDNLQTKHIPVIFATGKRKVGDEERGLKLGAIDYVSKPFCLPIVKMRVKNHLELKRRGDLLEAMATIDGLTGIANRRKFDAFLQQEWFRAMRLKTWISIIMLDIDYFKRFNDHYGHIIGDDCLKLVANTVAQTLTRSADLVARYGGEEFICVLTDTPLESAVAVAEKIKTAINTLTIPHEASPVVNYVTISLGVSAVVPNIGTDPLSLVMSADRHLYVAKENGRNGFSSG